MVACQIVQGCPARDLSYNGNPLNLVQKRFCPAVVVVDKGLGRQNQYFPFLKESDRTVEPESLGPPVLLFLLDEKLFENTPALRSLMQGKFF